MKFKLQPYSIHELGQRQNQEDSMFPAYGTSTSSDRLYILCDGMGGHEKGEVASATVCEAMSNTILSRWNADEPLSDGLLLQAIEDAYDALDGKDNGEERKMGTTMTFVCFHADGVTVAHIGDSRVYQLRPATKKEPARIMFQTRDHSLVNDLIAIGEITEEEAKTHPQKNVITRAMQPCQERRAKATIAHLTDIKEGDYFYMCSDGMLEQTTDENLLFIITNPKTGDKDKVEMLREVTSENKDNHTAHLIHINKAEGAVSAMLPPKHTMPQGIKVVAEEANAPKKGKKMIAIVAAVVALLAIVAGIVYFLSSGSDDKAQGNKQTDTVKIEESNHQQPSGGSAVNNKEEVAKPDPKIQNGEAAQPTTDPADKENKQAKQEPKQEASQTEQPNNQNSVSKFLPKQGKPSTQNQPSKPTEPQATNISNKN